MDKQIVLLKQLLTNLVHEAENSGVEIAKEGNTDTSTLMKIEKIKGKILDLFSN